jgi:hypothetical protein
MTTDPLAFPRTLFAIMPDKGWCVPAAVAFSEATLRPAVEAACRRAIERDVAEIGAKSVTSDGDVERCLAENVENRAKGGVLRLTVASKAEAVWVTTRLCQEDEVDATVLVEHALSLCPIAATPLPYDAAHWPGFYIAVSDKPGCREACAFTPEEAFRRGFDRVRRDCIESDARDGIVSDGMKGAQEFSASHRILYISAPTVDHLDDMDGLADLFDGWAEGWDECIAALRSTIVEGLPPPFTYYLFQHDSWAWISATSAGMPDAIRAWRAAFFENNDPANTGYSDEEVPAVIEQDVADMLSAGVGVVVSAANELVAFRSWREASDATLDDLPNALTCWRSRFPAPDGIDTVSAYVEQTFAAWQEQKAENAREEAERRAERERTRVATPPPKEPEPSPGAKALGAVLLYVMRLSEHAPAEMARLASGLAEGRTLTLSDPPYEDDDSLRLPDLDDDGHGATAEA